MPIIHFNVTDIAHDDHRMEDQLRQEVSCTIILDQDENNVRKTGRKIVLDPSWTTLAATAQGVHNFLYQSDIEFILIKTECETEFRRILPIDTEIELASIEWDNRISEQYYIFKVDPAQKVIIPGSPTVRFFRCPHEGEEVSIYEESKIKAPLGKREKHGCAWEAEDVYQQRDRTEDKYLTSEHLAEVARRFKAWRAMNTGSLFVYLMVPKQLSESKFAVLREKGVELVADVSWVL